MGIDAGDLNNDGLPDLVQMDMTPADNRRNKANMASMNPPTFYEMVSLGMHFQYMQNSIQLNQGVTDRGYPHFSDMARITGMSATDWSWSGLIVDLDNNGWKDVFITNGTRKDINNKDYFAPVDKASKKEKEAFDLLELSKNIPHEEIDNFAFRNNGDLSFTNVTEPWGLSFKGFSNGATYADLDNDGDLEVIINNIDHHAIVFENHTSDKQLGNYLRIQLIGQEKNPQGLGARILLTTTEGIQYHHHTLTRGFQSSVEPTIHFGVGDAEYIEKIEVTWPDGKQQVLNNIDVNQILEINYLNASSSDQPQQSPVTRIFKEVTSKLNIDYRHQENVFNDFQYEVLLPHIYSRNGPGLEVGDVNDDGLDDFYVGGAIGSSGELFLQQPDGSFQKNNGDNPWHLDSLNEDMGALLFDADQDGDLDLYVEKKDNEYLEGSPELQDGGR